MTVPIKLNCTHQFSLPHSGHLTQKSFGKFGLPLKVTSCPSFIRKVFPQEQSTFEPISLFISIQNLVPSEGLEPTHLSAEDFESSASADSATMALATLGRDHPSSFVSLVRLLNLNFAVQYRSFLTAPHAKHVA